MGTPDRSRQPSHDAIAPPSVDGACYDDEREYEDLYAEDELPDDLEHPWDR
jgi:hypothetical protein